MHNVNILRAVGRGCSNRADDVRKVQSLLNQHRPVPLRPVDEDGVCGLATIAAIEEFQRRVVGMVHPDGKIDPQGTTMSRLSPVALASTPEVLVPYREGRGLYVYTTGDNLFGTTRTIGSLQQLARRLGALGADVGVGHLSLDGGGPHPSHKSHRRGVDVDIRPLRKDGQHLPVTINDPQYDREMTTTMVRFLREDPNLQLILFNDTTILGVTFANGHDNHLHVRFRG